MGQYCGRSLEPWSAVIRCSSIANLYVQALCSILGSLMFLLRTDINTTLMLTIATFFAVGLLLCRQGHGELNLTDDVEILLRGSLG